MSGPSSAKSPRRFWLWLLVVPLIATAFPQLYARTEPTVMGMPFFYWYQLAWTLLTGIVTGIAYLLTREPER